MLVSSGITRFKILNENHGRGAERFKNSEKYWSHANKLYRQIFDDLGTPLIPGETIIECSKEDFVAGYDHALGIDVILYGDMTGQVTLQEKFLFTGYKTVTIEHCQDWMTLEPGDWYKMKAQYYFVGYDENQLTGALSPWMLLDMGRLRRATGQRLIPWKLQCNDITKAQARADLMYCSFDKIPPNVVVASSTGTYSFF